MSDPDSVQRALRAIERVSLALETPVNRLVGRPQFNPLYHTGTITAFLLVIIVVTGVYLTMFYQFGFADSYVAVSRIEQSAVGRIMRALHRYASDLALIAALLHGWRIFFADRFRQSRRRRWLTGVLMAAFIWAAGMTGYWLVADARAQVLDQMLVRLLSGFSAGVAVLSQFLTTEAAGPGWEFLLLIFLVHVGLTFALAFFFWRHVRRLARPRFMPPRYFMVALMVVLVIAAIITPLGMLSPRNSARIPEGVVIDPLFLSFLPAALSSRPLVWWLAVAAMVGVAAALPWLLARQSSSPVTVLADRCTGCTLCEADCPYNAITMIARPGGGPPPLLARVDPARCVSCGICVGACLPLALSLDGREPDGLWRDVLARASAEGRPVTLVFACERQVRQGAASYLTPGEAPTGAGAGRLCVIPINCAGMANPNLVAEALEAGATAVQFVGCPPEECLNREGNLREQERIERKRPPRLRASVPAELVVTDWLSPADFTRALRDPGAQAVATAQGYRVTRDDWPRLLAATALIATVLAGAIVLGRLRYQPMATDQAVVALTIEHGAGNPLRPVGQAAPSGAAMQGAPAVRIAASIDGQTVLAAPYTGSPAQVKLLRQISVAPGARRLTVVGLPGEGQGAPITLYDTMLELGPGDVANLHLTDARTHADAEAGRRLYFETSTGANTGCRICHSLEPGVTIVGPSLAGVATRAETAAPGLTAEAYLRQSILEPDAHLVEGFPAGQMLGDFGKQLSPEQLDDLVAFLLTLR